MNNEQIIAEIAEDIYGTDKVMEFLERGKEIPLHTVKGWAERAYRVKKGEHGLQTRLWKKRKRKAGADDEQKQEVEAEVINNDYYLAKAYLFREDQVEMMKGENNG